jgi:prepilin-type N-terminal cleavage/methylation domain-containing protein
MMIFSKSGIINKDQKGFTLIELLIAVAITGIIAVALTMTISGLFRGHAQSSNEMDVVRQVQSVGHWVTRDTQMAEKIEPSETDDPDTTEGTDILTLYWTQYTSWTFNVVDGVGELIITSIKHKITYNLDDERLLRYHYKNTDLVDGLDHTWDYPAIDEFPFLNSVTPVAQFITYCDYNQGTDILTVTASVSGFEPKSETREYEIIPRPDEMY